MAASPVYDLDQTRQAFPIAGRMTYLSHASISPIPLPAQAIMDQVSQRLVDDPMAFFALSSADPLGSLFVDFPAAMARLINAQPREIVGVVSTSAGLNAAAQAIDWRPGDNVVFVDVEFPSNVYPWMALERRGVECRQAAPDCGGASVQAIEPHVDAHTRVVAVSAVQFFTGQRADLAALGAFCRERGILFVVDAIQAAGHIPIDVQAMQIDILSAGGQKSLMGPPGQGFLYVREEVCEQMRPASVGPTGVEDWEHWLIYDLKPHQGAQRFSMGTVNLAGMAGLMASVAFLRGLGLPNIDAWTRHLSQVAVADLTALGYRVTTPTDPARLGPIVTFRVGDLDDPARADVQANAMLQHFKAHNIRVIKHWDKQGAPHIRISSHCYNSEEDVHRVSAVLEGFRP